MKAHPHRLIFNKSRGCLVAVVDNVRSCGDSGVRRSRRRVEGGVSVQLPKGAALSEEIQRLSGQRCLSTKLSAFLNGYRYFFWQHHMLARRVQPDLFDVLPVARLP